MKKRIKIISFVILIAVILIFGYVIYSNATKNNEQSLPEKVMTEIRYLEGKLIEIANQTNNIVMQNYKVSVKSIEEGKKSDSGEGENATSDSRKFF